MKKLLSIFALLLAFLPGPAQQYINANLIVEGWTWTADTIFLGLDQSSCYITRRVNPEYHRNTINKST